MSCDSNCNCSNCASSFLFPVGNKGDDGDKGDKGDDGAASIVAGTAGTSAFVYIAYATSDAGAGFSLTDPTGTSYLGVITSSTEITTPVAANFAGKWQLVKGASGALLLPVGFVGFYVGDTRALGSGSPASKGSLADNLSGSLGILDLDGWALCDGSTHSGYTTPDWTDKFVMSTVEPLFGNAKSITTTGGQDNVTLGEANLPPHSHPGALSNGLTDGQGAVTPVTTISYRTISVDSGGGAIVMDNIGGAGIFANSTNIAANPIGNHIHTVTADITVSNNTSANDSFDNRPAFIRAAAIVRLPA